MNPSSLGSQLANGLMSVRASGIPQVFSSATHHAPKALAFFLMSNGTLILIGIVIRQKREPFCTNLPARGRFCNRPFERTALAGSPGLTKYFARLHPMIFSGGSRLFDLLANHSYIV